MRCVCQIGTRKSLTSPVVSVVAWRCAACFWKNQTCCCSTNRPTTDAESVARLERFLHDFEGTVVAITHDRYFLDNVAGWILELDRGEGIPWEGNYSSAGAERSAHGAGSFTRSGAS